MLKKIISYYINDLHIIRTFFRKNNNFDISNSWKNEPSSLKNINFHSWFDTTNSIAEMELQSEYDFNNLILQKNSIHYNNSCEIGFGSGRLLYQASKKFINTHGIDIHINFDQTLNYLFSKKVNSILLNPNQYDKLPKIDFFYSFMVIQHFNSINILHFYLKIINEKLQINGTAVLFYGVLRTPFFGKYYEINPSKFRKRECSLFLRGDYMESLVKGFGFKIVSHDLINKKNSIIDNQDLYSMQAKIIFKR